MFEKHLSNFADTKSKFGYRKSKFMKQVPDFSLNCRRIRVKIEIEKIIAEQIDFKINAEIWNEK